MSKNLIENEAFNGEDYTASPLPAGDYEECTFTNCNFANSDLSEISFIDCTFDGCDLSNAKTRNTAFREVAFNTCKMLGRQFGQCNKFLFQVSFKQCQMNYCSFYQWDMKGTRFKDCALNEADFVEANLTHAVFAECDLWDAMFENTLLEGTDFRTATNFTIDPESNHMNGAKFSADNLGGLLRKYRLEID